MIKKSGCYYEYKDGDEEDDFIVGATESTYLCCDRDNKRTIQLVRNAMKARSLHFSVIRDKLI